MGSVVVYNDVTVLLQNATYRLDNGTNDQRATSIPERTIFMEALKEMMFQDNDLALSKAVNLAHAEEQTASHRHSMDPMSSVDAMKTDR
ncbi:hypothetical protein RRG08_021371 [Elysia crispata]|uniref:Uncharacterized protein n=1 Tax=Elysia crispata TaxID=231223 RepID=A0AAE0YCR6_9GAST|nr:hypothetical protein RRG08_021371 [Elysia crispata]